MSVPPVGDEEMLYRNVRVAYCTRGWPPQVLPEAFFDPARRPSVDRADLCGHDPYHTRRDSDGVAVLKAREVRDIGDVVRHAPLVTFTVDVEAKPIVGVPGQRDNWAHAEIFLTPATDNDKVFRRLRVALARLANGRPWAIMPVFPPD